MARVGVLILGIVVLLFGTLALAGSAVPGVGRPEHLVESFVVEPGGLLRVVSVNGRITYETWEGDEVVIEALQYKPRFFSGLARRLWGETRVAFSQTERGVQAVVEPPVRHGFFSAVRVEFFVKVPRGWHGDVTLTTSNGAIVASDIHGRVALNTSNGAVTVNGHTGTLEVRTSNGALRLSDVHGAVDGRTSNGPITLAGGTLTGSGQLRTSNGAVELRARLEEGAGYDVHTSNGAVTVTLVDPDAAVELRTSNGNINLQAEVKTSVIERGRIVGTIGEGAARLSVRTSNGSVTLAAVGSN